MTSPIVAFDESGNTGQDLLNPTQPVFVLASVHFSDSEIQQLVSIISPHANQEIHFKNMKKYPFGQKRILELLHSDIITPQKVRLTVCDKSFMVITKIVDMLIEPLTYRDGIDLYERGVNIAMANLYFYCMPVFCGEDKFKHFLHLFVKMIRVKTYESIKDFYDIVSDIYNTCEDEKFKTMLSILVASEDIIGEVVERRKANELDPAVPFFVNHCDSWGRYFNAQFDIIHDKSKPIEQEQELLSYLMIKDEKEIEIGYDRRKMIFPLKAKNIQFCDSKTFPILQITDIFAGACSYWAGGLTGLPVDQVFWNELDSIDLRRFGINAIWSTPQISQEELGTNQTGGINMVSYLAEIRAKQQEQR